MMLGHGEGKVNGAAGQEAATGFEAVIVIAYSAGPLLGS